MSVLYDLNERQREAAEAADGPLLIVAGPGTGKTKTLIARITYLLGHGVQPQHIAALTFTNKAAREMEQRLEAVLGAAAAAPKIATFHSLGQGIIHSHGESRRLASEQDLAAIMRDVAKSAKFKSVSTRELSVQISRAKTSLAEPPDKAIVRLLQLYESELVEQGLWDFDDLLRHAFELLRNGAAKLAYSHVLVDEFQDTSELQYEILKLLGAGSSIFAIGDPNQSIYAFRGAGQGMFERFRTDFPAAKQITLTDNYRSRPQIVSLENAIFPDSAPLRPHISEPGQVQITQTLNEYSEAAYVIAAIEQGIGGSNLLNVTSTDGEHQPRDYAILYRTHRAAAVIQKAFAQSGLPYQIAGEGSPYERPTVQSVVAALRYLHDPVCQQLPAIKGLSNHQIQAALDPIDATMHVSDLAAIVASRFAFEDGELQQLFGTLVQFGAGKDGLAAALQHIDDIRAGEFYDPGVNAVTLMTIHASKGLEFEHVFLIGAEEGTLPKQRSGIIEDPSEEKRLFYVAATRAKASLSILYAKVRAAQPAQLSRFAVAMPASLLPRVADPALPSLEKRFNRRVLKRAQTRLL